MRRDGWFLAGAGALAGLASALESLGTGIPLAPAAVHAAWAVCLALVSAAVVAATGHKWRAWWQRGLHIGLVCALLTFGAASLTHSRAFQMDVVVYTWAGMAWTTTLALLASALLVGFLTARAQAGATRTPTNPGSGA